MEAMPLRTGAFPTLPCSSYHRVPYRPNTPIEALHLVLRFWEARDAQTRQRVCPLPGGREVTCLSWLTSRKSSITIMDTPVPMPEGLLCSPSISMARMRRRLW